ncbi:MAG: hypothetical protein JXA10_02895 [Anaerolineae bacterium]|nr:hypothetical protein [Anaerolineae bacterium]
MARLYPDVYDEVQHARLATQGELFDRLFALADAQNLVRPDLNRAVARTVIREVLVNVLRSPKLTDIGREIARSRS